MKASLLRARDGRRHMVQPSDAHRGMISTDTSTNPIEAPFTVSRRWSFRRLIVPVMIGLALTWSFATFLVMAELTPIKQSIDPTEELTFWSRWSIDDITFWSLLISAGL